MVLWGFGRVNLGVGMYDMVVRGTEEAEKE